MGRVDEYNLTTLQKFFNISDNDTDDIRDLKIQEGSEDEGVPEVILSY